MVRKILLVMVLVVMTFSLISCRTVQGLGEDIRWTGEKGSELVGQQ